MLMKEFMNMLTVNSNDFYLSFTGNFRAGESGTILKKLCPKELKCLQRLMTDILRPYVPEYKGDVENDGDSILVTLPQN